MTINIAGERDRITRALKGLDQASVALQERLGGIELRQLPGHRQIALGSREARASLTAAELEKAIAAARADAARSFTIHVEALTAAARKIDAAVREAQRRHQPGTAEQAVMEAQAAAGWARAKAALESGRQGLAEVLADAPDRGSLLALRRELPSYLRTQSGEGPETRASIDAALAAVRQVERARFMSPDEAEADAASEWLDAVEHVVEERGHLHLEELQGEVKPVRKMAQAYRESSAGLVPIPSAPRGDRGARGTPLGVSSR